MSVTNFGDYTIEANARLGDRIEDGTTYYVAVRVLNSEGDEVLSRPTITANADVLQIALERWEPRRPRTANRTGIWERYGLRYGLALAAVFDSDPQRLPHTHDGPAFAGLNLIVDPEALDQNKMAKLDVEGQL